MKTKLKYIDLFSGAGGFSLGFDNKGFQNVGTNALELAKNDSEVKLYLDSIKSPKVPNTLTIMARINQTVNSKVLEYFAIKKLLTHAKNKPPKCLVSNE